MGARQKLNSAYFSGSLLMAGLVGWLFGSWWAFLGTAVVMLAINLTNDEIRPSRGGW